ncbi:MAG TPA: hypothetical protein DCL72_05145 [Rhizobiales bacterium]|nr:hypothetical protein [Hyphomicrobiales bacterium]
MSLWIAAGAAEIAPYNVQMATKIASSDSDDNRLGCASMLGKLLLPLACATDPVNIFTIPYC